MIDDKATATETNWQKAITSAPTPCGLAFDPADELNQFNANGSHRDR